jgi:hypothetical protein
LLRRVDPDGGRFGWRRRGLSDEALGVGAERLVERLLAGGVHVSGLPGLVVTCVPKVPIWKTFDFNCLSNVASK